jgi:hypothetical protein
MTEMKPNLPFELRYSATINETVAATGIGRTKLYEMIRGGEVETTNIGTRRLVLVRSVINRLNRAYG